jgi:hypothetical protein
MIRHKQAETAMPDELVVIMRHPGKNAVADAGLTQLIFPGWQTFDGDEKPIAIGYPLRNRVGQLFTDWQIHAAMVTTIVKETKRAR